MNWWRGIFRLWVGGVFAWVALLAWGALHNPQDATELVFAAVLSIVVGIFGAWVLRGLKPRQPQ